MYAFPHAWFESVALESCHFESWVQNGRIFGVVQLFLASLIRSSNILVKLQNIYWAVKCLECISNSNKNHLFFTTKVTFVTAIFIRQRTKKSLEVVGDGSL